MHPIKSLRPMSVTEAAITPRGGLAQDREFAIFDAGGKYVNAKRNDGVFSIEHEVDWTAGTITFWGDGNAKATFALTDAQSEVDAWLSNYFEQPVTLQRDTEGGFPDDPKRPGPTIISQATLDTVASWFPGLTSDDILTRFRANLVIDGVPAFWEDQLYGPDESTSVTFQIGEVIFEGVNPCQRCTVPPRDPETGEPYPHFSETFRERREATLPDWAPLSRFNHYWRLAVNTCVPTSEVGKIVRVGDPVVIVKLAY